MATLPGLNYATPLMIGDLQHLEETYTDEFVRRTLAMTGSYRAAGARHGILDETDPVNATSASGLFIEQNPNDGMTVDVYPGVAVVPNGMLVIVGGKVEGVEMSAQQLGQQNVVFVEYQIIEDDETISVTRGNTSEARQLIRTPDDADGPSDPRTVQVVSLQDWQNNTLFPPDRRATIVPLALVSIVSITTSPFTEAQVDLGRTNLPENRPWFSPVDIEHRSEQGTGSADVPHRLGLNDLSQGALTLYDQLLPNGMVLGRDRDIPGVPGGLCIETITPTRVKTDVDGSVTGTLSQRYVELVRFPIRLLGAHSVPDPDNEILVDLIPHTNLLIISHDEGVPDLGFRLLYSTVDAGEPLTNSLINDEVHFRQPGTTEELLVAGGRAHTALSPSFTDAFGNVRARVSIGTAGGVPRRHRIFADQDGQLLFAPQHLLCSTLLDDIGTSVFNFQVALLGTARVTVALQNVDLTAPTVVRLRLTGVDNLGATVTEDVRFDFSNFDNPVVGTCEENSRNFQTPDTAFSSLTSLTVLERTADGPNTAVCVYADLDPVQSTILSNALPLAEVMWDGAQVCRVQDIRPVAATLSPPSRSSIVKVAGQVALMGFSAAGFAATEIFGDDLRDPHRIRAVDPMRFFKHADGLRSAGLPETIGVESSGAGLQQDLYVSQAIRLVTGAVGRFVHVALLGRDAQSYVLNGVDGVTPNVEYRTSTTVNPTTWVSWGAATPMQGVGQANGHNYRIAIADDIFKFQLRVKGSVVGILAWQIGGGATSGVLFPRLTTAQRNAIGNPIEGAVIYNTTTNTLDFYNGTSWAAV